jgi:hypothetical protein
MNTSNSRYSLYLSITNDWPLDDWSITKECFDKIVEILPFDSTILEIGSGQSTNILQNFYKMISIESSKEWLYKYNSEYLYVPLKEMNSETFGKTNWLDVDILKPLLHLKQYDMLIVDAGGDRIGIYDNLDLFDISVPIIFDDTMCESYLNCANLVATKLNKLCTTYVCKVNKYVVHWFNGKHFSLIM